MFPWYYPSLFVSEGLSNHAYFGMTIVQMNMATLKNRKQGHLFVIVKILLYQGGKLSTNCRITNFPTIFFKT